MDLITYDSTEMKIVWHENINNGSFAASKSIANTTASDVDTADFDNDGDIDIFTTSVNNKIVLWYQNDGHGNFQINEQATIHVETGANIIRVRDVNNDGLIDVVLSVYPNSIVWHKNEGDNHFGTQQIVTAAAKYATDLKLADLDKDGDVDILSSSWDDDKVAWYANDGNGNFGEQQIISTAGDRPNTVYVADVDKDGDLDVLATSYADDKVALFRNLLPDIRINPDSTTRFVLFPNPTANQLQIKQNNKPAYVTYAIYNVLGSELIKGSFNTQTLTLDVTNLSKGMYLVQLKQDRQTQTIKWLKQ